MIVAGGISIADIARRYWRSVLAAALTSLAVVFLNDWTELRLELVSQATVGILIGALSIFIAFRIGEAYCRWWEARTLWGALLNDSRTFARQVLTLVRGEGVETPRRVLVKAQVGFVNALRLHLRRESSWDELAPWLPAGELELVRGRANVPQAILLQQAERLAQAREREWTSEYRWTELDATLRRLTDQQGGCERIKNTVFPESITVFTLWLVRSLILAVPLVLVGEDDRGDWMQALEAFLICAGFLLMERLGHELKTPFEGAPNDTPMSAICRTVERDLSSLLGERELPPPLEPEDGALL